MLKYRTTRTIIYVIPEMRHYRCKSTIFRADVTSYWKYVTYDLNISFATGSDLISEMCHTRWETPKIVHNRYIFYILPSYIFRTDKICHS